MKYKCRIIHKETKKPYTVASGVYEMPREEVVFDSHQQAQEFIKDRPSLTYELVFEKIEPEPFNPETTRVFVERPAHTMRVGDFVREEFQGEVAIMEVTNIGKMENNVFEVVFDDYASSSRLFAINEKVLFLEEFEVHYELLYSKVVPIPNGMTTSTTGGFVSRKWSPSREIHNRRLADLKAEKNWKISNIVESVYLKKKISERSIDE